MKLLHTIAGVWSHTGGPAASVPGLCSALARRGHDVTLLTGEGTLHAEVEAIRGLINVETVPLGPYRVGNFSRAFALRCLELAADADVLHTHGLWLHPNYATWRCAVRTDKPLVVSPRGMLAGWALGQGRWRKRIAWTVFQRRLLASAAVLHATTHEEATEFRAVGLSNAIATIPNGVDLTAYDWDAISSFRGGTRDRAIVFISRIHPKKGLDLLLAAWTVVAARHPEAELLLAGPGEDAHVDATKRLILTVSRDRVAYIGALNGEAKRRLLSRAVALILPSYSENYGMVVAESLACGTPVIVSKAVPWPEVESSGCGWWVDLEIAALAEAMDSALSSSVPSIDAMGARGRKLVEQRHCTDGSAARMEAAYAWAAGQATAPDFMSLT